MVSCSHCLRANGILSFVVHVVVVFIKNKIYFDSVFVVFVVIVVVVVVVVDVVCCCFWHKSDFVVVLNSLIILFLILIYCKLYLKKT